MKLEFIVNLLQKFIIPNMRQIYALLAKRDENKKQIYSAVEFRIYQRFGLESCSLRCTNDRAFVYKTSVKLNSHNKDRWKITRPRTTSISLVLLRAIWKLSQNNPADRTRLKHTPLVIFTSSTILCSSHNLFLIIDMTNLLTVTCLDNGM